MGFDIFKVDLDFVENEKKYEVVKKEILGDDLVGEVEDGDKEFGDEDDEDEFDEEDEEDREVCMIIQDEMEINFVNLWCIIYFIIMFSVDFEEVGYKFFKIKLEFG